MTHELRASHELGAGLPNPPQPPIEGLHHQEAAADSGRLRSRLQTLPTLLVFSDDWGRHPSSCQHLVRRLLPRYRVLWVNTIGMRVPRFDLSTLRRGGEKIGQWLRPKPKLSAALPENLQVLNPKMWPWMRSRFDRSVNRRLLRRELSPLLKNLTLPALALTTVPTVADLVGVLPIRRWLYYCVDDFSQWPGLDHAVVDRLERDLVAKVSACVAVSDTLRERLAAMGRQAHLLTHGVDSSFWSSPGSKDALVALEGLERPLIVFWGLKDRRLDGDLIRRLSASLNRGTVVFAGPENQPDAALMTLPHVHPLGALPFEDLPRLGQEASVLIMPYANLPVTRAMNPLKLKEYLATGKPVVARRLPALHDWADCLDLAESPEDFAAAVARRLETGLPPEQQAARARLSAEDWDAKADQLERWLLGEIVVLAN
jgi:glycosyltransferase involved in cell wall biosynthesis